MRVVDVYGDESSDEGEQRAFALAGIVGDESAWQEIERQWLDRNGSTPFHAKECDSNWGDYKDRSNKDNKDLYRDLAIMLANSHVGGWAFGIDLQAQGRVFPDSHDLKYYKCFAQLVEAMVNFTSYNKRDKVRFTFDMRLKSQHNTALLYESFVNSDEWSRFLHPKISFVCSKDSPRVQMADLFAREAMKALDNLVLGSPRPMRKAWKTLFDSGPFHVEVVREDWFLSLQSRLPDLEKHTGMSMDSYEKWITERNCLSNTTNLFEYMKWAAARKKSV